MRLSNKQVQANLKFIEFSCKKPEIEIDEEKDAIINKVKGGDSIKTAPDLMQLTNKQQQSIYGKKE